jgi:hypothetical protein
MAVADELTTVIRLPKLPPLKPTLAACRKSDHLKIWCCYELPAGDYKQGEFIAVSSKSACCAKAVSTQFLLSDVIGRPSR